MKLIDDDAEVEWYQAEQGSASSSSGRREQPLTSSRDLKLVRDFGKCNWQSVSPQPKRTTTMPQLISPLALRALRTLVQRPAISRTPLRSLTTATTSTQSLLHRATPITGRFNFQPIFRTQTAQLLARRQFSSSPIVRATYNQVRRGCRQGQRARRGRSPALKNHPSLKGVCLKTGVTKPKKPNSGERKTARVRLSSGKVVTTIIPGEGHNIQQHSVVHVRGGRAQDCPGVKYHLVRGAGDLGGVGSRQSSRSKYGTKKPKGN
ncbi:unnamed protein product [Penicillium pancosmium]